MFFPIIGMIWNFFRALKEDKEEEENDDDDDKDTIEKEPHSHSHPPLPTIVPGRSHVSVAAASSGNNDSNGGCYVPDGGFPINTRIW